MRLRWSLRTFLIPGIVVYLVAVAFVHVFVDDVHIVVTGIGFATLLVGLAAVGTLVVKVREYFDVRDAKQRELERRIGRSEDKINGGLAEAARQHMQEDEVLQTVLVRMDRFERERDECLVKYDELRAWMLKRLDESGIGRSDTREDT